MSENSPNVLELFDKLLQALENTDTYDLDDDALRERLNKLYEIISARRLLERVRTTFIHDGIFDSWTEYTFYCMCGNITDWKGDSISEN